MSKNIMGNVTLPSFNDAEDLLRAVVNETHQPLTKANNYCQVVLMEKAGNLTDEQKELLNTVLLELGKVEQIIDFAVDELNRISG